MENWASPSVTMNIGWIWGLFGREIQNFLLAPSLKQFNLHGVPKKLLQLDFFQQKIKSRPYGQAKMFCLINRYQQ